MNGEELSAVAGVLLSVECSYLPGVKGKFKRLDPTRKRLVMLGLLALASLGVFLLSCLETGVSPIVQCSRQGAINKKRRWSTKSVDGRRKTSMVDKNCRLGGWAFGLAIGRISFRGGHADFLEGMRFGYSSE